MLGRVLTSSRQVLRASARSYSGEGGVVGENLPFNVYSRYKFTAIFIAFFGTGLALPFLVVRHQLLKK